MRVPFKRSVSSTACFYFQSNGAARQREPFIFDSSACLESSRRQSGMPMRP